MLDWFFLLAPLALLAIVALCRFVGCSFDSTAGSDPAGLSEDLVGLWKLDEPPGATTAQGPVDGTYKMALTAASVADDGLRSAPTGVPLLQLGEQTLMEALPTATSVRVDGGFVDVPFDSTLNPDSFTIEIWVQPEWDAGEMVGSSVPSRFVLASHDVDAAGLRHGYALYAGPNAADTTDRDQYWQVRVGDGTATWKSVRAGSAIDFSMPTHLALTYDRQTEDLRLYVNGTAGSSPVELPDGTMDTSLVVSSLNYSPNTSRSLRIGMGRGVAPNDPALFPFKGRLQSVVLYKAALPAVAIDNRLASGWLTPG